MRLWCDHMHEYCFKVCFLKYPAWSRPDEVGLPESYDFYIGQDVMILHLN